MPHAREQHAERVGIPVQEDLVLGVRAPLARELAAEKLRVGGECGDGGLEDFASDVEEDPVAAACSLL
eukprot:scaffold20278_cov57-Phaeocystis_antarctica.AAC.3